MWLTHFSGSRHQTLCRPKAGHQRIAPTVPFSLRLCVSAASSIGVICGHEQAKHRWMEDVQSRSQISRCRAMSDLLSGSALCQEEAALDGSRKNLLPGNPGQSRRGFRAFLLRHLRLEGAGTRRREPRLR